MANKSYKGRRLEIELAEELSLWWSNGKRDDLLWHTHDSGGRATRRSKKGKSTEGLRGDICAVDLEIKPLIDLITWEAKKGYNAKSCGDLLDCPYGAPKRVYQTWIETAHRDHLAAGSFAWMLVHKRDRRLPVAYFPERLWNILNECGAFSLDTGLPLFQIQLDARSPEKLIVGMPLANFYKNVRREHILDAVRRVV